jgi:hypothetical protein
MRFFPVLKIGIPVAAVCLCLQAQEPPGKNPPSKDTPVDIKGMPPRPTPADYPDQAEAGKVTIAAEFQGHAVPTLQGNLTNEDYVSVETGFFGPPGARIKLSIGDFMLRINGKKTLPSQPYGVVLGHVKDPEWVPPEPVISKEHPNLVDEEAEKAPKPSSSGLNTGGNNDPPPIVRVPLAVQRALNQRVQKAALPEGDRTLPVAGLVFFEYSGKVEKIHTIELIYSGAAGKASLTLDR